MDLVKQLFNHLRGGAQCILAVVLAFVLVASMVPVGALPAYASEVNNEEATGEDPPADSSDSPDPSDPLTDLQQKVDQLEKEVAASQNGASTAAGSTDAADVTEPSGVDGFEQPGCSIVNGIEDDAEDPGAVTITEGGTYALAQNAAGIIRLATAEPVTIVGTGCAIEEDGAISSPSTPVRIDATAAPGADITLQDIHIYANADTRLPNGESFLGKPVVAFAGEGNTLAINSNVALEADDASAQAALVGVPSDTSLTLQGEGALYLSTKGKGAAIGGNAGETNGAITLGAPADESAGLGLYVKAAGAGTAIGTGADAPQTQAGAITFRNGMFNLATAPTSTAPAVGTTASDAAAGPKVTLGTHANVSINVNGEGAAIRTAEGALQSAQGALRTYIGATEAARNAYADDAAQATDAALTAAPQNASGQSLVLLPVDTALIQTQNPWDIRLDGEPLFTGSFNNNVYIQEAVDTGLRSGAQITNAPQNWVRTDAGEGDGNLYFHATPESHTLTVGDQLLLASWDEEAQAFTVTDLVMATMRMARSADRKVVASATGAGTFLVNNAQETVSTGTVTVTATPAEGSYLAQIRMAEGTAAVGAKLDYQVVATPGATGEGEGVFSASVTLPAGAEDVSIVADFVPIVWDGTLDTSWYNPDATSFDLYYPAQQQGAAAIVNGCFTMYPTKTNYSPDYNAYLETMGNAQRDDGTYSNNLYGEFRSTYTQPDAQLMLNRATQSMSSFNSAEGFGFSAAKTRTQRVVGDADALYLYVDNASGSTATTSGMRYYGKEDFAGKQLNLVRDMDFGAFVDTSKEVGEPYHWNTDSPLYMPLGGYYDMIPLVNMTNGYSIIGASFNGILDGCGHTMSNVYGEHFTAGSSYGDSIGVGFVGGLGGFVGQNLDSTASAGQYRPSVRRLVLDETCYFSGRRSVGGIVGLAGRRSGENNGSQAVVEYCINKAFVKATDKFGAGGVVGGAFMNGIIDNCANFGTIWQYLANPTGGITGYNRMQISNCFNVGWITSGADSYSMGIGTCNAGPATVQNCYFTKNTSYQKYGSNGGGYFVSGVSDTNNGSTQAGYKTITAEKLNAGGAQTWVNDIAYNASDPSTKGVNWVPEADSKGAPATNMPKLWFQGGSVGDAAEYTVTIEQGEGGSIGASTVKGEFGDRVFLTNVPQTGYLFVGYEVLVAGAEAPTLTTADSVTISGNMTVKGVFKQAEAAGVSWNTDAGWKMDVTQTGSILVNGAYQDVKDGPVANDADATDVLQGNVLTFRFMVTGSPEDEEKEYTGAYGLEFTVTGADGKKASATASGNLATPATYQVPADAVSVAVKITPTESVKSWSTHADTKWYDEHSSNTEFIINTPEELAGLSVIVSQGVDFSGKTVNLGRDIDLYCVDAQGVQRSWEGIGSDASNIFCGTFDGQGHTIKGMRARQLVKETTGSRPMMLQMSALFNIISGATIKNVVIGAENTIALAGVVREATMSTIENCVNYASTTDEFSSWTGQYRQTSAGIVGIAGSPVAGDACLIRNCVNKGDVEEAGIVGEAYASTIERCVNEGSVRSRNVRGVAGIVSHAPQVGGKVSIVECLNKGIILCEENDKTTSTSQQSACAGGIFGYAPAGWGSYVEVLRCANTGAVRNEATKLSAQGHTGGLVGMAEITRIADCYNVAPVEAAYASAGVGGLAGSVTVSKSYEDATGFFNCYNVGDVQCSGTAARAIYGKSTCNGGQILRQDNNLVLSDADCLAWPSGVISTVSNLLKPGIQTAYFDMWEPQPGDENYVNMVEDDPSTWPPRFQGWTWVYGFSFGDPDNMYVEFQRMVTVEEAMESSYPGCTTKEECYAAEYAKQYGADAKPPAVTAEELRAAAPVLGSAWKTSMLDVNNGFPMLAWQLPYDLNFVDGSGNVLQSVGLEAGYTNTDASVIEGMFTGQVDDISGEGAKKGYIGAGFSGWASAKNGTDAVAIRNASGTVTAWPIFGKWIRDLAWATVSGNVSAVEDGRATADIQVIHDGTVLKEGYDYTLTCTPSRSESEATVSVTGIKVGGSEGSTQAVFQVGAAPAALDAASGIQLTGGPLGQTFEFGTQRLVVVPMVERYLPGEDEFASLQAAEICVPPVGMKLEDFRAFDVNLVMVDLNDPSFRKNLTEFDDDLTVLFSMADDKTQDFSKHTALVTQLHKDGNGMVTKPLDSAEHAVTADGTVAVKVKQLSDFAITLASGTPAKPPVTPDDPADPEKPGTSDTDKAYQDLLNRLNQLLAQIVANGGANAGNGAGAAAGQGGTPATVGNGGGGGSVASGSAGSAGSAGAGTAESSAGDEQADASTTAGSAGSASSAIADDITPSAGAPDGDGGIVHEDAIPWWVWLVVAAAVAAVAGAVIVVILRRKKAEEELQKM